MGNYLNPGNEKFRRMIQSEIYVDKTGMIKYTNSVLDTAQNYVCVSRPRRFGKSMAANMLTAYYSRGCDSKKLFHSFEIEKDKEAQEKYLDFLRDLLKDKACIYLSYMTGILPIKKYGTHSALNMFDEFSMINPGPLACYVGFTEKEVEKLCKQY